MNRGINCTTEKGGCGRETRSWDACERQRVAPQVPPVLTGLLQPQLDSRRVILVPLQAQHLAFPRSLAALLLDLTLRLRVDAQKPRTQSLVQPQEDVPVVVDVEEIVSIVRGAQLLGCRAAEKELRLGGASPRAAAHTVVLLSSTFIQLCLLLLFLLHVGQLPTLGEQHVGDEMMDHLLDLVLVLFLNAGLPLDVMDDECSSVLQDLTVLVGQAQVWASVLL